MGVDISILHDNCHKRLWLNCTAWYPLWKKEDGLLLSRSMGYCGG